ncbi:TonB-dependent receptor [Deminuibacter soli]|uniref:TonB-dependent receptor n=1 Tax=Deminuibacter soli TaxID=2291815 RepID=A0A3E1NNA2_9BACT|nr:TonB-dependent receptor [Deminuibacter soli]RFM29419.1 TonB-dependent receptor [Deminuibacter soli]
MRITRLLLLMLLLSPAALLAQLNGSVVVSGKVTTPEGQPVPGAAIQIQGTKKGTVSDSVGHFSLIIGQKFPFRIVITSVGFLPQEFEVKSANTKLAIQLTTQTYIANEVVVTASRQQEKLLQSPVTIEKLDIRALKETPAASFYDAIGNLKNVQMTTAGLTFKIFNTRGFNVPNNFRFMQLIDGVDNQAATLGVPLGNAIGPSELDIQSIEVTPGASSALYGMNALNGMSNLITKSPFKYQGLSVYQKGGLNHFDGKGSSAKPLTETSLRFAKAFNDKFAFKVNFTYFKGTDWYADNHTDFTPNLNPAFPILNGANNIANDAWNKYGDNSNINITDRNKNQYTVHRTGYWERDLVGDNSVGNTKVDVALHYRITPGLEISYAYRYGKMDGFFQRGNRIGLQGVTVQNHKIELTHADFSFKAYTSIENTGHSYNMNPLADNLEKSFKSDSIWSADYTRALNAALAADADPTHPTDNQLLAAHQAGRAAADAGRYTPGTAAFNDQVAKIKKRNDWDIYPTSKDTSNHTGGAALLQRSHFYHAEGTWNLRKYIHFADVLLGADYRLYKVQPDGNNFVDFSRPIDKRNQPGGNDLKYAKTGGFVQVAKTLLNEKLKLTGSLRYDKNDYFSGKFNPRVSAVYTLKEKHNFRASFQTGYRFPALFEAFSFVNNGQVRRVGGLPFIETGLGYFQNSYLTTTADKYATAVKTYINTTTPKPTQAEAEAKNAGILKVANLEAIKPEQIHAFEAGYKTVLADNKVFIDIDGYYSQYKNFIGQVDATVPLTGDVQNPDANVLHEMTDKKFQNRYRVWTNSKSSVSNYGVALGVTYNFYKGYTVSGNANFNKLSQDKTKDDALIPGFNTPEWFTNLSFGNRAVTRNLGFNVVWHWQQSFYWQNLFGNGTVPAYGTIDAQVTYHVPKWQSSFKLGGTDVFNHRYFQYVGGPTMGALYYVTWTFDGLFK